MPRPRFQRKPTRRASITDEDMDETEIVMSENQRNRFRPGLDTESHYAMHRDMSKYPLYRDKVYHAWNNILKQTDMREDTEKSGFRLPRKNGPI